MYGEFREHGGGAFSPDTSGAMLCEADLLVATSPSANGSSMSRVHTEDVRGDQLQMPEQPHAEQEGACLENTSASSSELHLAGSSNAATSLGPDGSSSAEQWWPPDIQWLPGNPLVSPPSCMSCSATGCCPVLTRASFGTGSSILVHKLSIALVVKSCAMQRCTPAHPELPWHS